MLFVSTVFIYILTFCYLFNYNLNLHLHKNKVNKVGKDRIGETKFLMKTANHVPTVVF